MARCRRCERVVVQPHAVYCGWQCTSAALGDARWRPRPATTHALQRGEHALLYYPGHDGGPLGAKKAYTAAAHFGKTNFGRKAAKKREGPKLGSKNSARGGTPIF